VNRNRILTLFLGCSSCTATHTGRRCSRRFTVTTLLKESTRWRSRGRSQFTKFTTLITIAIAAAGKSRRNWKDSCSSTAHTDTTYSGWSIQSMRRSTKSNHNSSCGGSSASALQSECGAWKLFRSRGISLWMCVCLVVAPLAVIESATPASATVFSTPTFANGS
jgi:hypothetical protein